MPLLDEAARTQAMGPALLGALLCDSDVCRQFNRSSQLEWLETNGLGSFASGTVAGAHTRRYHGLFCAATRPPLGRVLTLAKLGETVGVAGRDTAIDASVYKGTTVHPEGHLLIDGFVLNPWPQWTYDVFGVTLRREIVMLYERQGVLVRYTSVFGPDEEPLPVLLQLRPLFAMRDYHTIEGRSEDRRMELAPSAGREQWSWIAKLADPVDRATGLVRPPLSDAARTELTLEATQPLFWDENPAWYFDYSYAVEELRGDPTREDLHSPGSFSVELAPDTPLSIWIGLEALPAIADGAGGVAACVEAERHRRARLHVEGFRADETASRLARAADQFIVRRGSGLSTVIAGYPWFTDWGRDTMIALPGLALATGRFGEARDILRTFVHHMDGGIIPNRFPDEGDRPQYNTVDATLWLFEATARYLEASGDASILTGADGILEALLAAAEAHIAGTHYDISVDPADGLLAAGSPGTQLTWMDVKYENTVFTPRHGKPVEINALWYSALRRLAAWLRDAGREKEAARYDDWALRCGTSFNARFWDETNARLFDVVDRDGPGTADSTLRPNQIFAISLPYSPLAPERRRAVLDAVTAELLTPYGLRSLTPGDVRYAAAYGGDLRTRDSRYHQGTVWAWLIGPYVEAYLRTHGSSPDARAHACELLAPLLAHLEAQGLGQIAEIFDGDPPHLPRGCFAQAWSVAEVLRVMKTFDLFAAAS